MGEEEADREQPNFAPLKDRGVAKGSNGQKVPVTILDYMNRKGITRSGPAGTLQYLFYYQIDYQLIA
jgi:hypothetical protein